MNEQRKQSINYYLRHKGNQARIWNSIQQAREHITVTISRAASLFDFSESKLREWEKRGLLQTTRPLLAPLGKGVTGHRQYSQAELDKLAIIKDLLEHGYTLNDIPADVDQLWRMAVREEETPGIARGLPSPGPGTRQPPIDTRVERLGQQAFWRYFVAQALRLSLALLCEDTPDLGMAGLLLPLQGAPSASGLPLTTDNLASLGPVCIGWRGRDGSFSTFLDDEPAFEYPSDFRCEPLPNEDAAEQEGLPLFVIVQRKARPLALIPERSRAIRRLLALVFARREIWRPCFDYGRRDEFSQAFAQDLSGESTLVQGLLEQVLAPGEGRWTFAVLLLPRDASLPLQQQSLVVCAQTAQSPFEPGLTTIDAQHLGETNSLTLRAFQSGQIVLAPAALAGEQMTHPLRLKVITSTPQSIKQGPAIRAPQPPTAGEAVHSAIAVPLSGEYGISLGVMYIEADHAQAFDQEDQRLLRLLGRLLEEVLLTARVRTQMVGRIGTLIERPALVDPTFTEFAGEADFLSQVSALLSGIERQLPGGELAHEEVSIISVDIDNQSSIAMKYDNRVARNLSQQVGLRIARHLRTESWFRPERLFHISADKYYILLEGVTLATASVQARQLQSALSGTYLILPTSATPDRPAQPMNMLGLPDVTVHIGVSAYPYGKLDELLKRYPVDTSHIYVRSLIVAGIEELLGRGKHDGGNCIFTWDRVLWGYRRLE